MATVQVCDGCGETGADATFGFVIQRDYCPPCALDVKAHLAHIDSTQEALAETWFKVMADLEQEWSKTHTGILPDR
jgi:hypothetical protein